jgi:hypothetical protein
MKTLKQKALDFLALCLVSGALTMCALAYFDVLVP